MQDRRHAPVVPSPVSPVRSTKKTKLSGPVDERSGGQAYVNLPGDDDDEDGDDEDEETLKLKLAAIEARLRLKRLQQGKKKDGRETPDDKSSVVDLSPLPPKKDTPRQKPSSSTAEPASQRRPETNVQVLASPVKKPPPPPEPTSPRRIRLGIDKGMKGTDVSLRRPPSFRTGNNNNNNNHNTSNHSATNALSSIPSLSAPYQRSNSAGSGARSAVRPGTAVDHPFRKMKSFSERMAESRTTEKDRLQRMEAIQRKRTRGFAVDKKELERYSANPQKFQSSEGHDSAAAAKTKKSAPAEGFRREDILRGFRQPKSAMRRPNPSGRSEGSAPGFQVHSGEKITKSSSNGGGGSSISTSTSTSTSRRDTEEESPPDPTKFEPFCGLQLSNRILPHSFLVRTFEEKTPLRIPYLLKHVKAPDFELPDIDGDYVVFGIVAAKSSPREHKSTKKVTRNADTNDAGFNNTSKYMVLTLTDLEWSIDLFLFDTALPRYYKLTLGTVIAILNPTVIPPPANAIDTGRFSLKLNSSDDTVLEIGKARDLGFCKSLKKDGAVCNNWIDARKTEFCDFHVDMQLKRTTAGRMEVNGSPGLMPPRGGAGAGARPAGAKGIGLGGGVYGVPRYNGL